MDKVRTSKKNQLVISFFMGWLNRSSCCAYQLWNVTRIPSVHYIDKCPWNTTSFPIPAGYERNPSKIYPKQPRLIPNVPFNISSIFSFADLLHDGKSIKMYICLNNRRTIKWISQQPMMMKSYFKPHMHCPWLMNLSVASEFAYIENGCFIRIGGWNRLKNVEV